MRAVPIITLGVILFLTFFPAAYAQDNDTLNTIFSRKSVRSYTDAAVSMDQLTLLAKAGMAAPTACGRMPWDFIIITDRECLKQLADALPFAKMAADAGAAIVVTGDLNRQCNGKDASYWMLDCSAASQNILLAAESIGLGAVWASVFPEADRITSVRKILGIPEGVVPLNLICMGVPKAEDAPKDKFDEKLIHIDKW